GSDRLDPRPEPRAKTHRRKRPRVPGHGRAGGRNGPPLRGRTIPMLRRLFTKLLVRPEDLTPMREDMEVISTFNPGVIEAGNEVVLLVRVAERPKEKREGYTAIPRFDPYEGLAIDWFPNSDLDRTDPRVVVH